MPSRYSRRKGRAKGFREFEKKKKLSRKGRIVSVHHRSAVKPERPGGEVLFFKGGRLRKGEPFEPEIGSPA